MEEGYCNEKKKPWPFDPIRFARIQQNEINYTSPRVVTGGVAILASERTSWQSFGALLAYVYTWVSGSKGRACAVTQILASFAIVLAVLQQCLTGEWFATHAAAPLCLLVFESGL
jgi:hypothetical protein